ncbi:MAG: type VI secretion system contractile sheath large subunit [Pseudomonadota bacterium]
MTSDIEGPISSVQQPRVRITYDIETGGAIEKRELPFMIAVFADLYGDRLPGQYIPPLTDRTMQSVDRDSFNDFMKTVQPRLSLEGISIPGAEQGQADTPGELRFNCLKDFEPLALVNAFPSLARQSAAAQADPLEGYVLGKQLSAVMHSPGFQQLEASWRGLHYLVSQAETSAQLQIRVLNASRQELQQDLTQAAGIDQTRVFQLVYAAEYDTLGGTPYSLLVGDYAFGAGTEDVAFLEKISAIAAAAHAPFISAASAGMFGLDRLADLVKPRSLGKIFEGAGMQGLLEFRNTEDSRYVALTVPRMLLRQPYGQYGASAEGVDFQESLADSGKTPESRYFLWGNAAYALAARIAQAMSRYGWPAAFSGIKDGLLDDAPVYCHPAESGAQALAGPAEVYITDKRADELRNLGFIPLCDIRGRAQAAFMGNSSAGRAKKYFSDDANHNARISGALPYMLAASRFAHYIKVIMRDKIGSFLTRGNVESYINTWISNYVLLEDDAPEDVKASFPLRAASVVVSDIPGEPGCYRATIFLKPHFQLEELTTSIRLEAGLPG